MKTSHTARRSSKNRSRISKMRRLYSSHGVDEMKIKENEDIINAGGTGDNASFGFGFRKTVK